jgi:hypothetical protein
VRRRPSGGAGAGGCGSLVCPRGFAAVCWARPPVVQYSSASGYVWRRARQRRHVHHVTFWSAGARSVRC